MLASRPLATLQPARYAVLPRSASSGAGGTLLAWPPAAIGSRPRVRTLAPAPTLLPRLPFSRDSGTEGLDRAVLPGASHFFSPLLGPENRSIDRHLRPRLRLSGVHPTFFQVKITLPSVRVHFFFPVRSQLDCSSGTQGRPA